MHERGGAVFCRPYLCVPQEGTQDPTSEAQLPQVVSPHCDRIMPEGPQNRAEALASLSPLQDSSSLVTISIIEEE